MKRASLVVVILSLAAIGGTALAKGPKAETKLEEAMVSAKADGKLLFIQMGRETCGNCQALKSYISSGAVRLPKERFVYVDLNCDNREASQAFFSRYKVDGNTLPFVVVADSEGKQLAGRSGYGSPEEFKKLVKEAAKLVPAKGHEATGLKSLKEKARTAVPASPAKPHVQGS